MGSTPLLFDQGLPRDAATRLRQLGHDCLHVGEIGMSAAEDREILTWALENRRAIVTLDADFHAELALTGACKPSVIRLRIQGLNGPTCARLIDALANEYDSALDRGCMISVKEHMVRLRWLPVGGNE